MRTSSLFSSLGLSLSFDQTHLFLFLLVAVLLGFGVETKLFPSSNLSHRRGVTNAAQRNILYELGIVAGDVPVMSSLPWDVCFIKYVPREGLKELVKKADAGEDGL